MLLLSACYSPERDLIQDPFNTPLIHILDSEFASSTGSVLVRWEYLGSQELTRVVILRRVGLGFDSIGVVTDVTSVGPGRLVDSFSDGTPPAGELLEYTIQGITPIRRVDARAVQVQIPGARLLRLRRNPFQGRVQVDWEPVGANLTSFEVVRVADGQSSSLVVTDGNTDTYVDTALEGNTLYTYHVLTVVSNGAALQSGSLDVEMYSLERSESAGTPGDRLVVTSGSAASSATMLALQAGTGEVDISKYRYFFGASFDGSQTVGSIREETVDARLEDADPASVTIAGPSVFTAASTNEQVFVAGRNAAGTLVEIRGYSLPNLTKVWDGPSGWSLSDPSAEVRAVQGGDGNHYFSAGSSLRAFTANLFETANLALPFGTPSDLDADGDWLWAVVKSESRIVRADITSGLGASPTWENVDFAVVGMRPTAMTLNRFGQIFVLDGPAATIYVFDTDLSLLLSWALPNEDFSGGSISLDGGSGNLIHVSSTNGNVHTYLP
jgi:hypothetical protein